MIDYTALDLMVDETFKKLSPPLSPDEYKLLEDELLSEGCREPIRTWNNIIIDGHARYEICLRHGLRFETQSMQLRNINDVIAWICINNLSRRNITEATRRYLIGKRYESEKIAGALHGGGENLPVSGNAAAPANWGQSATTGFVTRTSKKIGNEYQVSHSTVEKYGVYSRAIDVLAKANQDVVPQILSGQIKVSYENVIELAKLPSLELAHISRQLIQNDRVLVGYANRRRNLENRRRKTKQARSSKVSVKDMPTFDPDAEISSLSLTIPSWISSLERTQETANIALVSEKARDRLSAMLDDLEKAAGHLLDILR
ncbi:hypothetical protein C4J81_00950 [Deltaproteobacteria bacterium Smac51]|nr:hypothetical protein C4J81_00950 [Deltaproteobacteria bacterium Smac51]